MDDVHTRLLLAFLAATAGCLVWLYTPFYLKVKFKAEWILGLVWLSNVGVFVALQLAHIVRPKQIRFHRLEYLHLVALWKLLTCRVVSLFAFGMFWSFQATNCVGFPTAREASFVLIPIFLMWFPSLAGGRQNPPLLTQISMILISCAFAYSVIGNSENTFSVTTVIVGIVVAASVAGERVLTCQAIEKYPLLSLLYYRAATASYVLPLLLTISWQWGGTSTWMSRPLVFYITLFVMVCSLAFNDLSTLYVQKVTNSPLVMVAVFVLAWIVSSLLGTFLLKVDLMNSSLQAFLIALAALLLFFYSSFSKSHSMPSSHSHESSILPLEV